MSKRDHDLTAHVDRLYRAAWAMCGSREDAEDLVQETYAKVLARPRRVRKGRELAYLLQALRNTYVSTYRLSSRRPATVAPLDETRLPANGGHAGEPEQALEVHELFGAIAALPDDFRLALIAIDVVGLSYREAADALGTIEATVTTRLFRARRDVVRAISTEPTAHKPGHAANSRPSIATGRAVLASEAAR